MGKWLALSFVSTSVIQELCVKGATNDSVVQAMMQAEFSTPFALGQTPKICIDLCCGL